MDVTIRPARATDAVALFPLVHDFATSFEPEPDAFAAAFHELLATPHASLLVAVHDDQLVGYLLGFVHTTFYANGRVAWVEELMVQSSARRQGVGRLLIQIFETWAVDQAARVVALATRRAAPFYTAIGYEESASYFRRIL